MKDRLKKINKKYLSLIFIALILISLTIYLILNMNNHYIKYENEVGDKYKIELTLKDGKVVKAYTTITFNSKDKKEQEKAAKYLKTILENQPDKYSEIKIEDSKLKYNSLKEMALKKDIKRVKEIYTKELYKNVKVR